MRFFNFFLVSLLFIFNTSYSQQNQQVDPYWELLFYNQRQEALDKFQKGQEDHISDFLTNEILKNENGIFANSEGFIERVTTYPDFEYYLYALWNQNFFFDKYLTTGFNNKNRGNVNVIELARIKNRTVKESLRYLKSAVAQGANDWETFYRLNSEIPAIREWQFCGSFENLNGSGLDTEYGPEKSAVSKSDFNANSNGYLNWYTLEGRNKEAYQYYSNHSEYGGGVNYAQTFFDNPTKRRAVIRLGSSDLAKIWLNDILIFENTNHGITDMDAYSVEVHLPQGNNRLLVKNADKGGIAYFIVRITDREGRPLNDLQFDKSYSAYTKSSIESLNPQKIEHPIEAFFADKLKQRPNDFFLSLCLINTYLRNSKYTEAKELLMPLLEAYPNSSFLRKYMIETYTKEEDYTSAKELQKNIEKDDEKYYLSYIYRFEGSGKLFEMPVPEFEKFVRELSEATDMDLLKQSAELLLNLRKEDKTAVKNSLNRITTEHKDHLKVLKIYLRLYSEYLNEDDRAIEILEEITESNFDYSALKSLAWYYDKQNKKEKALKLFENKLDLVRHDNIFLSDYIEFLHRYERYEESLTHLDRFLKNYPYSFTGMELKGVALEQLNRKKEALALYRKSLKHNGANSALRKKIEDLSDAKDYFEELAISDVYDFIAENRNLGTKNNYGFNYLLDESLLQLYPEGGGKSKKTLVVEITSNNGIESLKEINLGLGGNYHILKSEIVKSDKKIVPASKSGSNLVFNNLEIGDIIYIDYENSFSRSGRFYKDYVQYYQFDSYHPALKKTLKILVPKNKNFKFEVLNGAIDYKKQNVDEYVYHTWEADDVKELGRQEDFMPSLSDISKYVHIGTIDSWNDIANWYSDLVRPQIVVNLDVEEAFRKIFPKEMSRYPENEKASRIYYYIMENFSYSHVGFRQSGYVPQKPSKTIKSKLGDCKDFSTLYVTLAQMAGLKSHLVLVLTSDYGERSMVLPSQDFNHCIAKVFIDGKPQYLELTDNNLPYKSIPTSLESATALDIPNKWVPEVKKGIYKLDNIDHTLTVLESNIEYKLGAGEHELKIESILKGSLNSHYAGIFKEDNYEVVKTKITEDFQSRITEDFTLDSIYNIKYELRSPVVKYTSDLTVREKIDKIGSMNVFTIPAINNAYNTSIIEDEKRTFPIDYLLYENADVYKSSYTVKLDEDESFVEVPKKKSYAFKDHSFQIEYTLEKGTILHIDIEAKTSKKRIAAKEYKEFKNYVKSVLDAKNQLIGFKRTGLDMKANSAEKK